MIPAWNPDARRARIKAIKTMVGPKGLALDEDTYRAMIGNLVPGKRSLTELNVPQLDKVRLHVQSKIDQAKQPNAATADEWRFVFGLVPDRQPSARKIYRLAERVGQLLTPPAPVASKRYIEGIASQMAGCSTALEFCDPEALHKIVQALEVFCRRHGV
ncbi:regulatory protein GemA [Zoogloea sp. 1C4]|uniref:regulatory protein GemA n=1 Tax=Zoogloea sp. 1C4 TaxID=2570190 RepID=UPI001884D367|nr:regulatory protein GemA [Zoogloea sp. 1C4]